MKRILLFCFVLLTLAINAQCWKEVSAGANFSAGIKTDGTLWIWGNLNIPGTGVVVNSLVPVQVGTGTNWKTLSVGGLHLMAIQNNGTLWGIGYNNAGQLGNGTNTHSNVLLQIGNVTNWVSITTGEAYTMGLQANGTLWSWGMNSGGQLGDGTSMSRNAPGQIGTDTDWQSVSATYRFIGIAIKTNGSLWVWGSNVNAPGLGLGLGTFTNVLPTRVGIDVDWKSVSGGNEYNLALKTNGTLWAWGLNTVGELGDGTTINKSVPTQIGTATDWQSISAGRGAHHSLGLKTSGTLWSWGNNQNGQLGIGTTVNSSVPVQVGVAANWKSVSAGYWHSLAIRNDGSLWGFGFNASGQIGDGTVTDQSSPVTVVGVTGITVTANATSLSLCAGSSVTLSGAGASTYTWTGGVSDGIPFVPVSSGVYTVTGSDAGGCYNTATVALTVSPNTTVTANSTSANICIGGTVALTGGGSTAYSWSNGVTNGVPFTPSVTTTYTVAAASGCSNTSSITVNVLPLPVVAVNSVSICEGSNALLTASVNPASGTTCSWSQGSTGNSLTVSPALSSSYTVTASHNGCNASAVASVTVIPVHVPVTGFSYMTPLCMTASDPLPTGVSGFSGGGTYFSGTGIATDPATGQINLLNSTPGTYVVTYSVAANGCNPAGSSTATITLNAPVAAVTGFSYPSPLCVNGADPSPLLSPGFTAGGSFSGPGLVINTTNGELDLSNTVPGTYTVTYSVNAANCVLAGTGAATVIIHANPLLSTSSATTIVTGEQTTLTAHSSANTYTWFPATDLSCNTCPDPIASPDKTTTYCIKTSDGICTSTACVTVYVEALCEGDNGLFLPNAFSPNGDGTNDIFCVQGKNRCVTDFQMLIFDRWGEQVFQCSDLSTCWDGTYKGKVLSPDVYVYYIKALDQNRKELIKKGNVTLVK